MEWLFPLIALGMVVLVLVAPIIALVRTRSLSEIVRTLETANDALRNEVRALTARIYKLEKAFERLETGRTEAAVDRTTERVQRVAQANPSGGAGEMQDRLAEKSSEVAPARVLTTPPPPENNADEARTAPVTAEAIYVPTFARQKAEEKARESRSWADMEEHLGENWLNKIGTTAFVIGVALLLNYSLHYLGPEGKIALGYFLAAVLVVVGVIGERTERYRIPARAVLGGGWALAYFTTYAIHNISSVRLVTSPQLGFALLFAVGFAMVGHSLYYHSEVTTAFAYMLAFASVAVSEISIGALFASALLATSLVLVLRARRWFNVEPFAIVATYLVHWMWLQQVYAQIGGPKSFAELPVSVTLSSCYWIVYMVSYFLRDERESRESQMLTVSFLLNAAGYLLILHKQSFHPEWRFWFLLGAGVAYLVVAALAKKLQRRLGFILASTLGSGLIAAAVPYRYSGGRLEILWLLEAQILLIAGWRLADRHLRLLAWSVSAVFTGYVAVNDVWPRFVTWRPPDAPMGWLLLAIGAVFYATLWVKAKLGEDQSRFDELAFACVPAVATAFLLTSAWVTLPFLWTGLAWVCVGIAVVEGAGKFLNSNLWVCGQFAVAGGVARLLLLNMGQTVAWQHVSLRLVTVGIAAAVLYIFSRRKTVGTFPSERSLNYTNSHAGLFSRLAEPSVMYTASATLLAGLLILQEASSSFVALAWGLLGVAVLEAAMAFADRSLLFQGRLVLLASLIRIFTDDLNSGAHWGSVPSPLITVGTLVAIYYYAASRTMDSERFRAICLWFGTIALTGLIRFELASEWVAVGWAVVVLLCWVTATTFKIATFRYQAYVMTVLGGVRCAFVNFHHLEWWHFTDVRTVTVVASAMLMYIVFLMEQFAKNTPESNRIATPSENEMWNGWFDFWYAVDSHPQYLFFFVPTILITALVSLEVRRGFLTAAWGIEALVVFLVVLKMHERAYRWFSLLLFVLCVGRIITVDVWNFDALGRIVSFLALGVALLAVSFMYARYREILRKVL